MYAEVILPLSLPTVFTYRLPEGMEARPGTRVLVPLGPRSRYKGMILRTFSDEPAVKGIRDIESVLDFRPLVSTQQLKFWQWLADYYMCSLGEVYRAAMPRGLKETYAPKLVPHAGLAKGFQKEDKLNGLMDGLGRAPKQLLILQRLVERLLEAGGLDRSIPKASLAGQMDFSESAYRGLLRKKIIREHSEQMLRMPDEGRRLRPPKTLTPNQQAAMNEIRQNFLGKPVVLLKGVTSSGKTEIYIHLIREMLDRGRQVLYLLPEIALTAQIVERLRDVFGDAVGIYHSKYPDAERVETFLRARDNPLGREYGVILGARSAVFLPFRDLGLVIIDEEQEQSYKQADPAPRYHARDAAVVLAELHSARVLLGSATPSFESYHNARKGKYGLVELRERFGKMRQPEIILANLREAYRKKTMVSHFTPELFGLMRQILEEGRQVILFQNRRGFSPYIQCMDCGWIPECRYCDVSLVYHKAERKLVCHYCGYAEPLPTGCPECGETRIHTRGFGTEKLEEEVEGLFPGCSVVRMDLDTTRSRKQYEKIIRDFEAGNTRILVGTQIVTKGLDFDDVGLVGVLHADNLLNFPDFRSYEKSYQLMSQVAGRSGRKDRRGKVVIQTSQPEHPVIQQIIRGDHHSMYLNQMEERQAFHYPPYYRLLRITLRHGERDLLERASSRLAGSLREGLQSNITATGRKAKSPVPEVLGPQSPLVSRVQKMHLMIILVKLPRTGAMGRQKDTVGEAIERIRSDRQYGKLFIIPDVDPY